MKLFREKFDVILPEGILYYPCTGKDTKLPIDLFGELVNEVHFADINKITLPYVECCVTKKCKANGSWQRVECNDREEERKLLGTYTTEVVKEAQTDKVKRNLDIGKIFKERFGSNVGDIRIADVKETEKWKLINDKEVKIVQHYLDGILTLLLLDKISVFFYRRDSRDYDGSNQLWFSQDIFDKLIDKLVNGAIIATDGSNYDLFNEDVAWNKLWKSDADNKNFEYKNCKFKYLGSYEDENIGIWQVTKI